MRQQDKKNFWYAMTVMMTCLLLLGMCAPVVEASGKTAEGFTQGQKLCHEAGVIGYTAVVDARAGVSMVEALSVQNVDNVTSMFVSMIVQRAYIWEGDPHVYAIRAYDLCRTQAHSVFYPKRRM